MTKELDPFSDMGNIRFVPDAVERAFLEEVAIGNGISEKEVIKAGVAILRKLQYFGADTSIQIKELDKNYLTDCTIPGDIDLSIVSAESLDPKRHIILPRVDEIEKEIEEEYRITKEQSSKELALS